MNNLHFLVYGRIILGYNIIRKLFIDNLINYKVKGWICMTNVNPINNEKDLEVRQEKQETTTVGTLFEPEVKVTAAGRQNQLSMTGHLTAHASRLADNITQVLTADPEQWRNKVLASQKSHDAMDDLINEIVELREESYDYLQGLDEEELEKMLRSQQSKRSRAKSKTMTFENYRTMMIGAIAENILRLVANKPKSAGGYSEYGDVSLSEEQVEELLNDPEKLKKAIRNVQSKKSIMRSKAGFSEDDPRFQQLLAVEAELKSIRDQGTEELNEKAKQALEAQELAEQMLASIDTEDLSGEDAKNLLNSIKEIMAGK